MQTKHPNTQIHLTPSIFRWLVFGWAALLIFSGSPLARAVTFTVNSTADTVDSLLGDGVCADGSANCTLRAAIMEANAFAGADIITLPPGTYTLSIVGLGEDAAATGDLDIRDALTLNGAGAATTIIDGAGFDRVFHVHVLAGTAIISRVTITRGGGVAQGGGVWNDATLTLDRSTVSGNNATGLSAGVPAGGGIYNAGTLTLDRSTVSGNAIATDNGGGIFNGGTMILNDSTVTGNSTAFVGGGILNYGVLTLNSSTVSLNTGIHGSGIYTAGLAALNNSTVNGNTAAADGGGIRNQGTLTLNKSTINGNIAAGSGGGIYSGGCFLGECFEAMVTIINSTFSGNNAGQFGGGIRNSGGTVTISSSTFSGNSAVFGGGGISTGIGAANVKNTIMDNSAGGNCDGSVSAFGNNLATDNTCSGFTPVTSVSINLGPLLVNAPGTTATHALGAGSVAIDAVTFCTDVALAPVTTDQRGVSRPQGPMCDIGAYEAGNACCVTITNKLVECVDTSMTYKWDFCITNCWTNTIKYLSILDLPPGVTPSEDVITLLPALSPGQGTCLTLYLTNKSGLEMTNLCFTVGAHTTNFNVCCSVTNCLRLPPCCIGITNDMATPIEGQANCYTFAPGGIKNFSATPIKYLFLVPQPDAPNNCFTFSPSVITFNPPLLPNQTAVPGQMFPPTVKITITPPCAIPLCYLAAAHDSNLTQCCSVQKYITNLKPPVDCVFWATPLVAVEGTDVRVPVIVDGSIVGARRLTLYEGTNAARVILNPTDGLHEDYFVLSNAVAGTYVFRWELTDNANAAWSTDRFTLHVERNQPPDIPAPAPRLLLPALAAGGVRFSLQTEPGVACRVEYTESLSAPDWKVLRSIVGDGSVMPVTDALTNAPQRFYRVRME